MTRTTNVLRSIRLPRSCSSRWLVQLLVGLAVLVALALVGASLAQPQIAVELGVGRLDRTIVQATVTNPDGSAVNRKRVEFYLIADFFPNDGRRLSGMNPVYLGADTTDTVGKADTFFDPPFTGEATIEARLIGENGRTEHVGSAVTSFVRSSNPVTEEASKPLEAVRLPLGFGILALVVVVWIFLLWLSIYTVRHIEVLGKEAQAQKKAHAAASSS